MKFLAYLCVAGLGCLPNVGRGAETAQARMSCLSLQFQRGSDGSGDYVYLTTSSTAINSELAPTFTYRPPAGDVYWSYFDMSTFFVDITGTLNVRVPGFKDDNGDGFDDFFQVSQSASGSTSGPFQHDLGGGTVYATWSRGAGSAVGSCSLDFVDSYYGDLGIFNCTFTLLEYAGPLTYTPGSTTVTGMVALVQTGNAANQFNGAVKFNKVATNRFDHLILQGGSWTDASARTLSFLTDEYFRDTLLLTNYYGYFDFVDGNLDTADVDYTTWLLSIDDTNDVNHNSIPDFSDNPSSSLPRRPSLSLARSSTNFWLTIHGDIGHLHTILQVSNIISTNWVAVTSVNLTTDPQTISLPLTAAPRSFWRVLAQ